MRPRAARPSIVRRQPSATNFDFPGALQTDPGQVVVSPHSPKPPFDCHCGKNPVMVVAMRDFAAVDCPKYPA